MVDILALMGELGITARVASNGSLLTDALLGRLRRETLTKSFQISLDTLDPGLYCSLHGAPPGTLERVLRALDGISEHGLHTTISVRLTPQTLPGVPQLLDRALEEGWATVTIHCPIHTRRTTDSFPQDADVLTILSPVFEHFLSLPERWLIETYIPWAQYHPVMERLHEQVPVLHRGCAAGRDRLTVNPTGAISPCVCLDVPAAHIGNVRCDDLSEVFDKSALCDLMRRPREHGICTDCPQVAVCGGGCRAAAFALTGRLDGQDGTCPVRQRRAARTARHARP
jgi:radical SAM protein with 4Fe4S-binding SPASM domain